MRELLINELVLVSGAGGSESKVSATDSISVGAAAGGFLGVAQGGGVGAAAASATAGAAAGAGLGLAFAGGYKAGEWLNENTPVQEWISNALDKLTQDGNGYTDPSGSHY